MEKISNLTVQDLIDDFDLTFGLKEVLLYNTDLLLVFFDIIANLEYEGFDLELSSLLPVYASWGVRLADCYYDEIHSYLEYKDIPEELFKPYLAWIIGKLLEKEVINKTSYRRAYYESLEVPRKDRNRTFNKAYDNNRVNAYKFNDELLEEIMNNNQFGGKKMQ
jgi:hypothetical protein